MAPEGSTSPVLSNTPSADNRRWAASTDSRVFQKIGLTVLFIALLAAHTTWPKIPSDSLAVVLFVLAVLPWLDSLVKSAELPGGWKIEFRELKAEVARQQEIINDLVKYSMSASIFHHLCGIALLKTYTYVDNDANQREFYFLRDNGFIKPRSGLTFVDFGPGIHGSNLADVAEPTPIGWGCVRLRKAEIPSNMRADGRNIRVQPETL